MPLKQTIESIGQWPLAGAVCIVARRLIPLGVLTALILGVAHYIHQQSLHQWSRGIETYIVLEQIRRSERLPAADLAFLGDSSCLMGIHVPTLLRAFPGSGIESFCTIGFVGPDGYGAMLEKMIARGRQPRKLVLVFNPIQYERDPRWNEWVSFIRTNRFEVPSGLTFPAGGPEYIRLLMERAVYNPLPGGYAVYYGGKDQFISTIWREHGSAIDPNRMLDIPSLDAYKATLAGHVFFKPDPKIKPFVMNAEFEKALASLSETLSKFDRSKVYLVITPVNSLYAQGGPQSFHAEAGERIAAMLGIDRSHFLDTPDMMLDIMYAHYPSHLHRWSRIIYTEQLAEALAGRGILGREKGN
ncbi:MULTISPECIES: hypothetical protein [Bradyrhizobium]|uniref:hypothetical protein n=1 Tax=Bradyrhizobium TaxID=374 RepID=UPI001BA8284D|nr:MULTISPECIES: hypothetical protein [Bradyrhizobium]MBR1167441.1 hypothetical protein [Bradyrhizobium liaoningense]UWU68930.1 hypothetical protein N2602_38660 [Bradyrhizobium sp. NC92]